MYQQILKQILDKLTATVVDFKDSTEGAIYCSCVCESPKKRHALEKKLNFIFCDTQYACVTFWRSQNSLGVYMGKVSDVMKLISGERDYHRVA